MGDPPKISTPFGDFRHGVGKGNGVQSKRSGASSGKRSRPDSASSASSVEGEAAASSPIPMCSLPRLATASVPTVLPLVGSSVPGAGLLVPSPLAQSSLLTSRPQHYPVRQDNYGRPPQPASTFPHLQQHGFRMDPFSHRGATGFVLRRAALPPIQTLIEQRATLQRPPSAEAPTSIAQTGLSRLTEEPFAQMYPNSSSKQGFGAAFLAHDGCLTMPGDLLDLVRLFEQQADKLGLYSQVASVLESVPSSVAEADALIRGRGPKADAFDASKVNSTTERKRRIARGLYRLLCSVLGGQKGFQRWVISEMERSLGVSGLPSHLHLFDKEWFTELLANEKLFDLLRRRIEGNTRPTRLAFAIQTADIAQRDINKLRALKPGFFPGTNQLLKARTEHLQKFCEEYCPGGRAVRSLHTELSEEAEEQAQQQEQDSARTADQQEMAAAAEQATTEIGAAVAAPEAESPVVPPPT